MIRLWRSENERENNSVSWFIIFLEINANLMHIIIMAIKNKPIQVCSLDTIHISHTRRDFGCLVCVDEGLLLYKSHHWLWLLLCYFICALPSNTIDFPSNWTLHLVFAIPQSYSKCKYEMKTESCTKTNWKIIRFMLERVVGTGLCRITKCQFDSVGSYSYQP